MNSYTIQQPETFHAFETRSGARRFRKITGQGPDNVIDDGIGWRLGQMLPVNATVYLWTEPLDATTFKWVDEIAATTKATLKRPTIPVQPKTRRFRGIGDCIRDGATPGDLAKAMAEADTVENTDEPTDYDLLVELKKKADAMTEAELQTERRKREIAVFENKTKHHDDDEVMDELAYYADHKPLKYEHLRESQAKRLGCRPPVLDKLIEERREPKQAEKPVMVDRVTKHDRKLQGSLVLCPDVEPWPEAVDGAAVLNEAAATLSRHVVLPDGAADALALWCAHTHCFTVFQHSPRLNVASPEKGCGKSTLRDVVALLVNRPLCLDSLTTAVTFRLLDKHAPTLLADEADAWLRENEELRGALNAGHAGSGLFARCEGEGNEVRAFKAFAPAALCGIGNLPGTLRDRSIVIRLNRAKPGELQARFDSRRTDKEKEIARKVTRFCADNRERLQTIEPQLPAGVHNRLADNWRPLFAIAQVAGGDWPGRCAAAFAKLNSYDHPDMETLKVMLLADIREVIADEGLEFNDWIETSDLIDYLTAKTERPWGEANRGKAINARWLSVRLSDFGIKPEKLPRESGGQKRGYAVAAFRDAFDRYLAAPPVTSGQVSQQPFLRGESSETDTKSQVSQHVSQTNTSGSSVAETDARETEMDSETDVKITCVSASHEGKKPSETDVHLKRRAEEGEPQGMTPGEFLAEAKRLFNAAPATTEPSKTEGNR